jgi:hypothetical protein
MRHYTYYNLGGRSQRSARVLFTTISELCETCLSVLLGIAFVDFIGRIGNPRHQSNWPHTWDLPFLALAFPTLLVARAVGVFGTTALADLFRGHEHRISLSMQVVIWFAGMRGSVSFALAITLPSSDIHDATWTVPCVTTTLGMILLTNFVVAPLTRPLIRSLKLQAQSAELRRTDPSFGDADASAILGRLDATLLRAAGQPLSLTSGTADEERAAHLPCSVTASHASRLCAPVPITNGMAGTLDALPHLSQHEEVVSQAGSPIHRAWRIIDQSYLKPVFGGRRDRSTRDSAHAGVSTATRGADAGVADGADSDNE